MLYNFLRCRMSFTTSIVLATVLAASGSQRDQFLDARLERVPVASLAPAHAFWDWQNLALFSGVAAGRAFDYVSTRRFRSKHLKEWLLDDKTVDNDPLFASIEIAATALSIGASYLLHHTGYHRLERWTSIVHITFATAGGIWNYTLPNGL